MNVREAMEAVKDGTFEEKLHTKKLSKEFMQNTARGNSTNTTGAMARGRDLHAAKHPTTSVNTNEEDN